MYKASLVLEGGATRGVFTAGVLDYLMEQEIYLSDVIGVSAGSCNAVDYRSKQIGRTRDCMIVKDKEYSYFCSPKEMIREKSLLDMDMVFEKMPYELIPFDFNTYFASEMNCEIVVTNCLSGRAEYLTEERDGERLMKLCRASSSLPLVAPIVKVDDTPYLDGGLADSIPLEHALESGSEKVVVVLTRNPGYRKKIIKKATADLYRKRYKKYPELVNTIIHRSSIYNRQMQLIEQMEKEGKIYVIRPMIPCVSRFEKDYDTLYNFYMHGYDLMKKDIDRLLSYLDS